MSTFRTPNFWVILDLGVDAMFKIEKATYGLFFSIAIVFILYVGKAIIIPIVWAFLLWYILKAIKNGISKIPFIGKVMPGWLNSIVAVLVFASIYLFITNLVVNNAQDLIKKLPEYSKNLKDLRSTISPEYLDMIQLDKPEELISNYLTPLIENLSNMLSSFLGGLFMVVLYAMFIFSEAFNFNEKMMHIFPQEKDRNASWKILNDIDRSISSYLGLKTAVSLLTGVISFIILFAIGVEASFFWAFVIFLLNFIPSVGSMIATIFPTLMALIQFGTWQEPLLVVSLVGLTQIIIGNIVEPRVMGHSLNLSSFVVILALSFWTAIWGVTGAILSVPIMVILMILFKQFEGTRSIARLLSEKGAI